jgi:hypothetical protein
MRAACWAVCECCMWPSAHANRLLVCTFWLLALDGFSIPQLSVFILLPSLSSPLPSSHPPLLLNSGLAVQEDNGNSGESVLFSKTLIIWSLASVMVGLKTTIWILCLVCVCERDTDTAGERSTTVLGALGFGLFFLWVEGRIWVGAYFPHPS